MFFQVFRAVSIRHPVSHFFWPPWMVEPWPVMACRWGLAAQFVQLLTHVHTLHVVALRQATSACYLTTRNYDEDGKELTAEVGCQNSMLAEAAADTRRSTGKPTMRRNRLGEGFHGSWKATSTRSSGAQLHVAHSHIVSRKLSRTTTTAQMAHGAYSFLNSLRIDFGQSAGMLANTCRYKNTMRHFSTYQHAFAS